MADFKLSDFRKDLKRDFGPFTIEFGTEDKPRTLELQAFVMAEPKVQVRFSKNFSTISGLLSGGIATDKEIAEALGASELVTKEGGFTDGMTEEDAVAALFDKATALAKDTLRNLATNKRDFDSFAKEFGGNLIEWFELIARYAEKYNLFGAGNAKPEEGDLEK